MKKLRNWFIGDYLAKTDNVFERAKITLTYNFAIFFILQAAVMYYNVISHHLWYHVFIDINPVCNSGRIYFHIRKTQSPSDNTK